MINTRSFTILKKSKLHFIKIYWFTFSLGDGLICTVFSTIFSNVMFLFSESRHRVLRHVAQVAMPAKCLRLSRSVPVCACARGWHMSSSVSSCTCHVDTQHPVPGLIVVLVQASIYLNLSCNKGSSKQLQNHRSRRIFVATLL